MLLIAPWTVYWDRNIFLEIWPAFEPVLLALTVRGGVSGLGVINLFAAITEFAVIGRPADLSWR